MKPFYVLLLIIIQQNYLLAQSKPDIKFGKIAIADFSPQSPVADSNANAIILSDIGSSEFILNKNNDFTQVYKRHKRILLKNRAAFDVATIKMVIYQNNTSGSEEKFEDFEASTYNIDSGKIVETKLDMASVFKEQLNGKAQLFKFTFPNVREGSIVEYTFTIKAQNNSRLPSWYFQDEYPVLWSQFQVKVPSILDYVTVEHGFLKYTIDSGQSLFKHDTVKIRADSVLPANVSPRDVIANSKVALWAISDVPAFKKEIYTSASKNYISSIAFQLRTIHFPNNGYVQLMKSWPETARRLLRDPDFGEPLIEETSWFSKDLKRITAGSNGSGKARKIFEYVRDNFTCTDHDALYLSSSLKKIFQSKKGNVADINLLLTLMLLNEGFDAYPAILSTKDNGFAVESAALLNQYNYVIAVVQLDSTSYLLDASEKRLGFGKIPLACYNGNARIIANKPYIIPLSSDSLSDEKNTSIFIINDEKEGLVGSLTSSLGYYESLEARDKLAILSKDDYIKEMAKSYPPEITISNINIDSLESYDEPLTIKCDMNLKLGNDDIVYFNPVLAEGWKTNPFTSADRLYPVEMPYRINETYILNLEIPKGYIVEELPKSVKVKLNETEGMFEYIIGNNNGTIQLRCKLILYKANFFPNDYQTLRDFFGYIVKKQGEQIVFKKAR